MPSAWPFPCRIQRGSGDHYYADGSLPMTTLGSSGVGAALNATVGSVGSFTATTTDFDLIQDYFLARFIAFAQLADCETCPGAAKASVSSAPSREDFDAALQRLVADEYTRLSGDELVIGDTA